MKLSNRFAVRLAALGACACACAAVLLFACMPAAAQTVDISTSPLYAGGGAAPNVAIVASFEFPTFGQAYLNGNNPTFSYDATQTYVGYFNPTKCYVYSGNPLIEDPNGYFYVSTLITQGANHYCLASFSGSYLNFATITAADEFRYALTGGNRVSENGPNSGTILQRAYLTGCNANVSNCQSFTNFTNQQVPGVPDFYANVGTFPTQYAPPGTLGGLVPTLIGGYVNNCKTFMYVSLYNSTGGGNCAFPYKDLGVYNVRVNVCDATEGPSRTDLCLLYTSSGKYKPVGVVQNNVNKMRFSIFGYLPDRSLPANGSVPAYTVPASCADPVSRVNPYGTGLSIDGTSTGNPGGGGAWNRCRVGGVLRAPMKYVGPTTFDANGVSSTNAKAEINADGTYVTDPEGTAAAWGGQYSGFINYLNRFGSALQAGTQTGTGGAGEYKRYDTLGEMYYEAIRYYQNLTPTPETYQPPTGVSSLPNQAAGYFPIVTTWTDPIIASCSKNYIVVLADAFTWDDVYMPGYAGTPVQPPGASPFFRASSRPVTSGLDSYAWTQKIGVLEATTPSITAGDVHPQMYFYTGYLQASTGIQNAPIGSQNTGAYFDAGAAYWANTNDIRSDLAGTQTIKTIAVDVGSGTSAVWDRQLYLMGKYGGFNNTIDRAVDGSQANPFYGTDPTNPSGPAIRTNSEWESSPGSAYPANYLFASSPQALISGLQAAFSSIAVQSGTAVGGSVTSASLNYGSAGTYVSQFNSAKWSGTVLYESVSSVNGVLTINSSPIWDAGSLLTTRCGTVASGSTTCTDTDTSVNKRNIFTTVSLSGTRTAKSFTYANVALDANYLYALNINPSTSVIDGYAQQRVNYLRGYRADEASSLLFRGRTSPMGDIINSAPVYVAAPTTQITDVDYQSFFAANATRPAAVFVGANDGMLHAFNATTGAEIFAYVPNFISSYLGDLTNSSYVHEPFVDSIPVVNEAKVNGTWKSVLVSGTGGGGQGVFGLDVSNLSTAFGPTNVLFEFSDADDKDMGNVLFSPTIVKLQTGTSGGSPTYGFFVAVTGYNKNRAACRSPGNSNLLQALLGILGLNATPACTSDSQGDAYVSTDTQNRGVLFLLSLDHTLGTPWVLNSNYYKFYFPANSLTTRNGLGPVAVLPNANGSGAAAALYFGDLQGDLWRFNTVGVPSAWAPSLGTVAAASPIFVASPSTNVYQPITDRPVVGAGPFGSTLVVFGTGAYLGVSDLATPYAQQSEYALIDAGGTTLISRSSDLQPRTATVSGSQVSITGTAFSYSGTGSKKGWYVDFPSTSSGERMVNQAAVVPGLLTFTSLTLSGSSCGSGGGYIYQVNPLSGLPLSGSIGGYISTVGIPGPPVVVDLSIQSGQQRDTGETINVKTQQVLVSGTTGTIDAPGAAVSLKMPPVGRVSWREITNYNDRH